MAKKDLHSSQEGLGISGFVLGILSIVFAGVYGVALGIIGIVFCMMQQKKYSMKLAKVGIILGVIGLIISGFAIYVYVREIIPLLQGAGLS